MNRRLAILLPLLATLLIALVGWLLAGPLTLQVGSSTDGTYLRGFFAREQGAIGAFRWSGPGARLDLPAVRGPAQLTISALGRPGGAPLILTLNDQTLGTLTLTDANPRRYRVLLPSETPASGTLTLRLKASADSAADPDDPRQIGAAVGAIRLLPGPGWSLPPLGALALLAGLTLLIYAGLWRCGARRAALVGATVGGALLALGWGFGRLWVGPYLLPTLLGAAVVVALLAAIRRRPALGPAELFGVLAVFSALIPLYTFVDYGWEYPINPENLPLLLLPLGLGVVWGSGRTRTVCGALAALVSLAFAGDKLFGIFSGDFSSDFLAMYRAVAWTVRGTGPMYRLEVLAENPLAAAYKYPPQFATLLLPLANLEYVPALVIWRLVTFGLLLLALGLLLRFTQTPLRSWTGATLVLLAGNLRAISDTLNYGQLDILLLLLLTIGLATLRPQSRHSFMSNDVAWGAAIGIGATFKLYPGYLLLYAVQQRRWRALLGALLAFAVLTAASLLAFGPQVHATFLTSVLPLTGAGTAWVENQTISGFLNRLRSPGQIELRPDDGMLRLLTYALALALTGLTAWRTRPGQIAPERGYGLWIVALLLILPAAWMHYQTLLLIPLLLAAVEARERPDGIGWGRALAYALAWGVLAHGNMWTFFDRTLHGPFWQLILSYKFYGMLLLYAACAAPQLRRTKQPAAVRAAQPQGSIA